MFVRSYRALSSRSIARQHVIAASARTQRDYASKPSPVIKPRQQTSRPSTNPQRLVVPTLNPSVPEPAKTTSPPAVSESTDTPQAVPPTPAPETASTPEPQTTSTHEPREKDPARGLAAAQEVVKTGRLPPEYKWASAKVTAIMTSIVLLIVLTPVLWSRVVMGQERKRLVPQKTDSEVQDESAGQALGLTLDVVHGDAVFTERGQNADSGRDEVFQDDRFREGWR